MAQLVAHCLLLPDLASWSSVDRAGCTSVHHKLSHFSALDVSLYPLQSVPAFLRMCEMVRGVEILILPYEHTALIHAIADGGWTIETGIDALPPFLQSNAATLRVIRFLPDNLCPQGANYFRVWMLELVERLIHCTASLPHLVYLDARLPTVQHTGEFIQQRLESTAWAHVRSFPDTAEPGPTVSFPALICLQMELASQQLPFLHAAFGSSLELLEMGMYDDEGDVDEWLQSMRVKHGPLVDALVQSSVEKGTEQRRSWPPLVERFFHSLSGLLSLHLYLALPFRGSSFTLHLPHLLQLMLADSSSGASRLTDVVLDCPSLISLNLQIHLIPSDIKKKTAVPLWGSRYAVPPSLLLSLARSPRLRFLWILLGTYGAVPDFSLQLTQRQRAQIDVKTAALGQPSLFAEPHSPHQRSNAFRVLLYAMSLLPCAAHLESLESGTADLSALEQFTLFPRCRSWCVAPGYKIAPFFLRPGVLEDGLHMRHVHANRLLHIEQRWDRLRMSGWEESAEQLTQRMHMRESMDSYLILRNPHAQLLLSECEMLDRKFGAFRSLVRVFLSAPTKIESAAVRHLLLVCTELRHLSLIQLEGVGDAMLQGLPQVIVRPALLTLRLKNCCEHAGPPTAKFTTAIISHLPRLFPSLQHLEMLFDGAGLADAVGSLLMLYDVQGTSFDWPHLRTLALTTSRAPRDSRAELALAQTFTIRGSHRGPAALFPPSQHATLQFITLEDCRDDPDEWPTHGRKHASLLDVSRLHGGCPVSSITINRVRELECVGMGHAQ